MIEYPAHGSKYFDLREFVDQRTWNALGPRCALLIQPRTVRCCDLVREKTGAPTTVNNWHFAKQGQRVYQSSGFRSRFDETGAAYSMHRLGLAADLKVRGMTPRQVLQVILANEAEFIALGLSRIEDLDFTPSWLHIDLAPRIAGMPEDKIIFFEP